MGITLQEAIRPDIAELLKLESLTIKEVSEKLGRNYFTVRGAMRSMQADGEIMTIGGAERSAKFTIGRDNNFRFAMPSILNNGTKFKIIRILSMSRRPDSAAAKALVNLPDHIALLMLAARELHKELPLSVDLMALERRMRKDLQALQNAARIYEAIVNNPKNWQDKSLSNYPNDSEWDDEAVLKAAAKLKESDNA